jgi:hypothetical protein
MAATRQKDCLMQLLARCGIAFKQLNLPAAMRQPFTDRYARYAGANDKCFIDCFIDNVFTLSCAAMQ